MSQADNAPNNRFPEAAGTLHVQLRDLPAMRVATLAFHGRAATLGAAVDEAHRIVRDLGVGPAGPIVVAYPDWQDLWHADGPDIVVDAEIRIPVTRLVEDAGISMRRLASVHAACLIYSGSLGPEFGGCHTQLFAWLDAQELPRGGTSHQHAYLGTGAGPHPSWTVEIRVLLGAE